MPSPQLPLHKLDLNLLRVLVAIYRHRQLAAAAAELALSASAISHALRRLREHFTDDLFVRNGRFLQPTARCEAMLPELNEMMARLQGLMSNSQGFNPGTSQRVFRLGLPEAMEAELYPYWFRTLSHAAPNAHFESLAVPHAQIHNHLLNRKVDVVVDVAMAVPATVQQQPLLQEPFAVLSSRRQQQQLTAEQYLASPHIAVSTRARGFVLEDLVLREMGIKRSVLARVQSYQTAAQLLNATGALLTLPQSIGTRLITQYDLRSWPMPFALGATRLQLYWHSAYASDPALQWLCAALLRTTLQRGTTAFPIAE